jgi:muramoyltetrapeptide carboxypeptidase
MSWQVLEKGDIVDIVAPGSGVAEDVLEAAKITLQTFGFNPRIPDNILDPHLFHSNSDEIRAQQLIQALSAKDSKAVWALRGGYGSLRLIPQLLEAGKPRRTKLFIGISDVTSIHWFLNQHWNWPTMHASLLDRVARGRVPQDIVQEMLDLLSGKQTHVVHKGVMPLNGAASRIGGLEAGLEARIRGGNLTTLQSHLGTKLNVKTKDHFLFLEDIGERGYRVDRMLEHLSQSGALRDCAGVLFGQFTESTEPDEKKTDLVPHALKRFADLNPEIPCWSGVESGHDVRLRPLFFETSAVLQHSVLRIHSGAKVVS